MPHVEVTKRYRYYLSISFSVSKLLHGENFSGIDDSEWNKIPEILAERLRTMGIIVPLQALLHARPVVLHLAMDFLIPDKTKTIELIQNLARCVNGSNFKTAEEKYPGGGIKVAPGNASIELAIYDKYAELTRDKESHTANELLLRGRLLDTNWTMGIIRIEIRLKNGRKIERLLKNKTDRTFEKVLNRELSLKNYLKLFKDHLGDNLFLLPEQSGKQNIIDLLKNNCRQKKNNEILELAGIYYSLTTNGLINTKNTLFKRARNFSSDINAKIRVLRKIPQLWFSLKNYPLEIQRLVLQVTDNEPAIPPIVKSDAQNTGPP
ncbi:MAG: hypothetical protein KBC69_00465 [Candidatus Magasanikbacteria bacterium]|nr:hypothetical protein [Candidatus Magasanikbacteria bacterium]